MDGELIKGHRLVAGVCMHCGRLRTHRPGCLYVEHPVRRALLVVRGYPVDGTESAYVCAGETDIRKWAFWDDPVYARMVEEERRVYGR